MRPGVAQAGMGLLAPGEFAPLRDAPDDHQMVAAQRDEPAVG